MPRLLAAQDAGGIVGGGALRISQEVSAVLRGVVGVPLQPGSQVVKARELRIRDGRQRGIVAALDKQQNEVVQAERDTA